MDEPEQEPPTEPLPPALAAATPAPPPPLPPPPAPAALGPFAHTEYRYTTGLRAGHVAPILGANGQTILSYRSFASIAGVVAAFVTGIVVLAGLASVVFLFTDEAPLRAGLVLLLTFLFAICIVMLAPRTNVTLYDDGQPALTISQRSRTTFVVAAPNGAHLAELRTSALSRLGRNRWVILNDGRYLGEAIEDSFFGALLRKLLGKFSRSFQTNVRITHGGVDAARILRRPDEQGRKDVLQVTSDALDRRVLVALATLILGREP